MSSLKLSIPHQLSQDEALTRIKGMIEKLKTDQKDKINDVKEEWSGNKGHFQFSARGFDLSGDIAVQASSVDIELKLPFAVSLFQGQIKQIITDKASEILAR